MGRLLTTGFESNTEIDAFINTGALSSSTVRSGAFAGRVTAPTTLVAQGFQWTCAPVGTSVRFFRFYLYIATLPDTTTAIFTINTGIANYGLTLSAAGVLAADSGTGVTGSTTLATGTWYCIEVHYDNTGTGLTDTFEFRVDGVTIGTSSALSLQNVTSVAVGVNVNNLNRTAAVCDLFFDDFAINDASGSVHNSWCGPGSVVNLYPAAAGDNAGFTILGSSPAATNWQSVKDHPADDGVTYVERSTTGIKTDDYKVDSPATAGIGASDAITLVHVRVRVGSTSNSASTGRRLLSRIKSAASGTVNKAAGAGVQATTGGTAGSIPVNTTGWATDTVATTGNFPQLVAYVDPTTGVPWTRDGTNSLSNMQVGIETETSSTNVAHATAVWAVVEYVPSPLAVSSADTGTATDAGESIAAAVSETESGTGTESLSAAATMSDGDAATGIDAESITASLSDADSAAASDAEAIAASVSDSDAAAGVDAESLAVAFSDDETAAAVDAERLDVALTDADSATGSHAEAIAASLSDDDTAAALEVDAFAIAVTDDDLSIGTDGESVAVGVSDDETTSAIEAESLSVGLGDDELGAAADGEQLAASITDGDSGAGDDVEQSLAVGFADGDTSGVLDDEQLAVGFGDDELAGATDAETATAGVGDDDQAATLEDHLSLWAVELDDTATATDAESIVFIEAGSWRVGVVAW